jgi:hypothetical protein
MKPTDKTMVAFYRQLGKIFYSIAAADKNVRKEEITKLKEIVQKEWIPFDDTFDAFGSDSAYQIEIVFDWLVENEWGIEQVFPDFKLFRREHDRLFTPQTNALILKTAHAIGGSFLGKNKSEQLFISHLNAVLEKQIHIKTSES